MIRSSTSRLISSSPHHSALYPSEHAPIGALCYFSSLRCVQAAKGFSLEREREQTYSHSSFQTRAKCAESVQKQHSGRLAAPIVAATLTRDLHNAVITCYNYIIHILTLLEKLPAARKNKINADSERRRRRTLLVRFGSGVTPVSQSRGGGRGKNGASDGKNPGIPLVSEAWRGR